MTMTMTMTMTKTTTMNTLDMVEWGIPEKILQNAVQKS